MSERRKIFYVTRKSKDPHAPEHHANERSELKVIPKTDCTRKKARFAFGFNGFKVCFRFYGFYDFNYVNLPIPALIATCHLLCTVALPRLLLIFHSTTTPTRLDETGRETISEAQFRHVTRASFIRKPHVAQVVTMGRKRSSTLRMERKM